VGVLGLFDKGKTFVLNKLFCMEMPSGKMHTTRGLSIIFDEHYNAGNAGKEWLLIDSAGFQATVDFGSVGQELQEVERRNKEEELIDQMIMYENFVFDMVSHTSHVALFIVNDLTWLEQRKIYEVGEKHALKGSVYSNVSVFVQEQHLMVVHNFRTIENKAEAELLFRQQVVQKYEGGEFRQPVVQRTKNDGGEQPCPLGFAGKKRRIQKHDDKLAPLAEHMHIALVNKDSAAAEMNVENIKWAKEKIEIFQSVNEQKTSFIDALCICIERSVMRFVKFERGSKDNETRGENALDARLHVTYDAKNDTKKIKFEVSPADVQMKFDAEEKSQQPAFSYTIPGYGNFDSLKVFQIEAPGVGIDDIAIKMEGKFMILTVVRKKHLQFDNKLIELPKFHAKDFQKERLPFSPRFTGYVFNLNRKTWKAPEACKEDPQFRRKQKWCEPVRLEVGILFLTARKEKTNFADSSTRRRVMEEL